MLHYERIKQVDQEIYKVFEQELNRQQTHLELIASENFVDEAVLEASGSILTNKYAEGYPGRRYYGGCEFVDIAENLAIERAKKLFGAEHVNVQPHSGSQANAAVYFAMLQPGDTILGMSLDHGGHLTHGSPVNFSGKTYHFVSYGVSKDTGYIDYEQVREQALKHKPKMIVVGYSAYTRILDFEKFRQIADEVGALFDGGYRPYCWSGCHWCASQPGANGGFCYDHHTQNAARPQGRHDHVQRAICKADR